MPRRTGWSRLTPGYRSYIERRGRAQGLSPAESRRAWERGAPVQRTQSDRRWDNLKPATKERYQRAGMGREEYRQGFTLRRPGPDVSLTRMGELRAQVLARQVPTMGEYREMVRYQRIHLADWQQEMPGDTALVFGHLPDPVDWQDVQITPARGDGLWHVSIVSESGRFDFYVPADQAHEVLYQFSRIRKEFDGEWDYHVIDTP